MNLLTTSQLEIKIADRQICRSLDFSITAGQRWGILGCNGAGKTTLLHTLAGLRAAQGGTIQLNNRMLSTLPRRQVAQKLGILFQQQGEPFPATVLETTLIGRHPFIDSWHWENSTDHQIAKAALHRVGLDGFENRLTNSLSGGEKQRLKLATLLTQNPKLMLLDEPTNHLDLNYQIRLLSLLKEHIKESNGGLLMSLHDINLAIRFCTHIMLLVPGRNPICGLPEQVLTSENLQTAYNWPIKQLQQGKQIFFYPE